MEQIAVFLIKALLWIWSAAFIALIIYVGWKLINKPTNKAKNERNRIQREEEVRA